MLQQIQEKAGDKFFKDYGEFAYLKLHFGGIEDLPPNLTENFSQLGKVNSALQQYYEKYQCYIAIRKLTPLECFRLQGWADDYFKKAEFVNSDSQLYKQAGNGVTVNVIKAIAERMKNE